MSPVLSAPMIDGPSKVGITFCEARYGTPKWRQKTPEPNRAIRWVQRITGIFQPFLLTELGRARHLGEIS
jgi:hypothetical protein